MGYNLYKVIYKIKSPVLEHFPFLAF